MAKVMIIGGHGKIALRAAPLLIESGHEVTSVFRNPAHGEDVTATGALPVVADVEQLDTAGLAELFQGQQVIVWSAGAGGGNPARTRAVDQDAAIRSMDAALSAGVAQYVMVSYFGSRPDHGVPAENSFVHYANAKAAADDYLRATGLNWTILGPSRLTIDQPTGRIDARTGPGPQGTADAPAPTSRANVALVIQAVVDAQGPRRATIAFTDGPTPINQVIQTK